MTPSSRRITSILLIVLFVLLQTSAMAQNAQLNNIIVTNTRDDLLLYLSVEGAFREKTEAAITSGVPATFSFFINLYRTRSFWLDKSIAEITVTHTIKFNPLKKQYIITRSWEDDKPIILDSFEEAKKLMTEVDSLKIIPLDQIEKGKRYQIRAKAELNKLTLPFYLHYVLFFVALWDFETDWYTIDFIY
jgi:hypothetical protein